MSELSGTRPVAFAIAGTLLVVALGIGGFALGRSGRTSDALVRAEERLARTHAYALANEQAFRVGREQGRAQGLGEGEAKGSAAGSRVGRLRGEAEAARLAARSARRRRKAATNGGGGA